MTREGKRVVVVGGGASGTLLAAHVLRDRGAPHTVCIIEPRASIGLGLAYSTTHAGHLLNVRAGNMSAFADDPGHFADWLSASGAGPRLGADDFIERSVYGAYLASLIAPYLATAGGDGRLDVVTGRAAAIVHSAAGYGVTLEDGRRVDGDAVVIATGNEARVRDAHGGPDIYEHPWRRPRHAGVPEAAAVLLLGTGLTMIDYVLWLHAHGHRGPIYALSKRGCVPQVHKRIEPVPLSERDIPFGASLVTHMRWLRGLVARRAQQGKDWRTVIDAVRPYSWRLWRELPDVERQRFLRHARPWWEIHRHRMAPAVEAQIRALRATGQLQIIAGKLTGTTRTPGGLICTYRPRGTNESAALRVANIVDCTGLSTDIENSRNPLIRRLMADGLVRADRSGLGIDTTREWQAVSRDGAALTDLFVLGPLTRGVAWETIAVPDIRIQCAEVARSLGVTQLTSCRA